MTRTGITWTTLSLALALLACGGGGDAQDAAAPEGRGEGHMEVDVVVDLAPDLAPDLPADLPVDLPDLAEATDAGADPGAPDLPGPEQWVPPEDPVSGCVICHTDKTTLLALAPPGEEPETEGGSG